MSQPTPTTTLPIVAVLGATGHQGGGLIAAMLADHNSQHFTIRAITRCPDSEASVHLKSLGCEIVKADLEDSSSLAVALENAYGVFVVTNFWEHCSSDSDSKEGMKKKGEKGDMGDKDASYKGHKSQVEMRQASHVANVIANTPSVQHVIWSSLEETGPMFDALPKSQRPPKSVNGYYVPHFDAKALCNTLFPAEKTTIMNTSFYLENLYTFNMIAGGVMKNNLLSTSLLPVISCEDIGKVAYTVFLNPSEYRGKTISICGDKLTPVELMSVVSEVTGDKFHFESISRDEYSKVGGDELANMFEFIKESPTFVSNRSRKNTIDICPSVQSAHTWAETRKSDLLTVGPKTFSKSIKEAGDDFVSGSKNAGKDFVEGITHPVASMKNVGAAIGSGFSKAGHEIQNTYDKVQNKVTGMGQKDEPAAQDATKSPKGKSKIAKSPEKGKN